MWYQSHYLPELEASALFHALVVGYHDAANSALSLIFEALYFGADICDLFLFNSEGAILHFALCHPRVNQMSLLTFSKTSMCYQLGDLIKSIYTRAYWDAEGQNMPSFS